VPILKRTALNKYGWQHYSRTDYNILLVNKQPEDISVSGKYDSVYHGLFPHKAKSETVFFDYGRKYRYNDPS